MPDQEKSAVGSEEELIFGQELRLADRLAVQRTVLAADRTMLAGVRTSLTFIGFGFTIFTILRYLQEQASVKLMLPHAPRNIGLLMLAAGTIPLFFMIFQYARILKRMGKTEGVFTNPNFQMAGVVFLLGIVLLVALIGNILLL